ncbi:type IV secretory system conjugative DNA transfer family protein [uncultured Roseibium sp.]|uniref:type IV secretory system conjugative DNA transfer family protein n=1 Tax=uncultured Roseibium sp. TaxID=1936171 RepID=UPI00321747CE
MAGRQDPSAAKAAVLTFLTFLGYRLTVNMHLPPIIQWLPLALLGVGAFKTAQMLYRDWRAARVVLAMRMPLGIEGSTHVPTVNDLVVAGLMISNPDGQGFPLGAVDGRMLFYDGPGHISIRAATNAGKTESSAALACFALGKDRNLVVTAKGPELVYLAARHRMNIGQDVIIIDPFRLTKGSGLSTHDFNEIGHLVRYADQNSPELLDKARKIALLRIPEPPGASGENKFFRDSAQSLLAGCMSYAACLEAETGELICNLPALRTRLCGSDEALESFLLEMSRCERYEGSIADTAKRFLGRLKRAPKTAEAILTEIENALALYDKGSVLGQRTEYSDFDPADIKKKPMTVFIVTDPGKSETHGSYAGAVIEVLMDMAIDADSFEPRVTFLLDEFANLSKGPIPSVLPALFIGRSRGAQLISYVQDTMSYQSRYGDEASAFTTQSEVIMAWSIRSVKDAEEYSKRAGKRAVVTENYNLPDGGIRNYADRFSLSVSEKAIDLRRPDDFLQLADFKAVLFFKQQAPQFLDLVSYRMIEPWVHQAGTVPGAPPLNDLPITFKL